MDKITKNVIEEAKGLPGFLVPEQVLPSKLVDYFGINTSFKMTVRGSMTRIEDETFFKVEEWELHR